MMMIFKTFDGFEVHDDNIPMGLVSYPIGSKAVKEICPYKNINNARIFIKELKKKYKIKTKQCKIPAHILAKEMGYPINYIVSVELAIRKVVPYWEIDNYIEYQCNKKAELELTNSSLNQQNYSTILAERKASRI